MSIIPRYTHIVNSKLKHTYLAFDEKGNLIIKSPKVTQSYIEKILLKKSEWINRAREKILQKKGKALDFSKESKLFFMGKEYSLVLQKQTKKRTSLVFNSQYFILYYYRYDEIIFQKKIDKFYREEAKKIILPLVRVWAKTMQLYPNKISFRKTKRQWGSCSWKNNLSFNSMSMKLPKDVIQYIIVHELAHIKYKHHQKSFWECVEQQLPQYKQYISELKMYSVS